MSPKTWCPRCGRVFDNEPIGAWCRHLDWTYSAASRRLMELPPWHPCRDQDTPAPTTSNGEGQT